MPVFERTPHALMAHLPAGMALLLADEFGKATFVAHFYTMGKKNDDLFPCAQTEFPMECIMAGDPDEELVAPGPFAEERLLRTVPWSKVVVIPLLDDTAGLPFCGDAPRRKWVFPLFHAFSGMRVLFSGDVLGKKRVVPPLQALYALCDAQRAIDGCSSEDGAEFILLRQNALDRTLVIETMRYITPFRIFSAAKRLRGPCGVSERIQTHL